jgi:hypothetical protein
MMEIVEVQTPTSMENTYGKLIFENRVCGWNKKAI